MKKLLSVFFTLLAFVLLVFSPDTAAESCRSGIRLCLELIIPSLFPFFILSSALNISGLPSVIGRLFAPAAAKIYGLSGAGISALIIGLTGGYPLGAAYIAQMQQSGAVSRSEGERLLAFCNNSGPAFIIGAVGSGVFHSASVGLFLYAVHILSALITGLFFRGNNPHREEQPLLIDSADIFSSLPAIVSKSVNSMLTVCGYVVCFSVIVGMLDTHNVISALSSLLASLSGRGLHFSRALLCGLLELGTGVGAMRGLTLCPENLSLAAGLIGWGGISVHLQTYAVTAESNIKGTLHFAGRLISASIASVLAYVIGMLIF